jgi:hypothetical protein
VFGAELESGRILRLPKRKNSREAAKDTPVKSANVINLPRPADAPASRSVLDELVREGARRMLQAAMEAEVEEWIREHAKNRRFYLGLGRAADCQPQIC